MQKAELLDKLHALDARVTRKGFENLDASKNPLVAIGMEVDGDGRVRKNSYGVFNLAWRTDEHPAWAEAVRLEVAAIRRAIREAHGVPLRFLLWAGMGGSAEDKSMYNGVGLLRRGPRCYVLDSTDPAKLKTILDDMSRRSGKPLPELLKSTLVVGMAIGMTSYEPVVNLEKLAALYAKHDIDARANFIYMTLPDSLLDRFGRKRGFRRIELQPDCANTTAGRHSAPMTRGALYPLALAGVDLDRWFSAAALNVDQIDTALKLAAFLRTEARAGRKKVTLLLPKAWHAAALWTKQDFEESLGKSEAFGIKIVIGEKPRLVNYYPPRDAAQDRCFLVVQIRGVAHGESAKVAALKRAGYPVAVLTLAAPELARYMQFIHYVVFGVAWLEGMNFVTQPGVELYKAITGRLQSEAARSGGIEQTREWRAMAESKRRARWRGGVTLVYDRLPEDTVVDCKDAASLYAAILRNLAANRRIEYGELTWFGDTRYSEPGKRVRQVLDRAGDAVFRSALRMPVDVYEGPAMNHSYHEMIIGHGRALSTVLLSETPDCLPEADYDAGYHRAQFLATQIALAERGRYVVAVTVKDLSAASLTALGEFFAQTAKHLRARRPASV